MYRLWDGDQVLPWDGVPQNLGNPCLSTQFMDTLPDTLVGMNLKLMLTPHWHHRLAVYTSQEQKALQH